MRKRWATACCGRPLQTSITGSAYNPCIQGNARPVVYHRTEERTEWLCNGGYFAGEDTEEDRDQYCLRYSRREVMEWTTCCVLALPDSTVNYFRVYNRWGKLLFRWTATGPDGTDGSMARLPPNTNGCVDDQKRWTWMERRTASGGTTVLLAKEIYNHWNKKHPPQADALFIGNEPGLSDTLLQSTQHRSGSTLSFFAGHHISVTPKLRWWLSLSDQQNSVLLIQNNLSVPFCSGVQKHPLFHFSSYISVYVLLNVKNPGSQAYRGLAGFRSQTGGVKTYS